MILGLNEKSEYGLLHYEKWINEMKQKYRYGKISKYELNDKVKYIQYYYNAIINKLELYEIIGFIIDTKNNQYTIKRFNDDIEYKNISISELKKIDE